jgi:hypothetical protein
LLGQRYLKEVLRYERLFGTINNQLAEALHDTDSLKSILLWFASRDGKELESIKLQRG